MKIMMTALFFLSSSAMAFPLMPVKERLRLHLWNYGLNERPVNEVTPRVVLPEEIERPLRKL